MRYNLDGIAARTFTAPAGMVESASLARGRSAWAFRSRHRQDQTGEVIRAACAESRHRDRARADHASSATRVRITARGGSIFYDNSTAVELVQQTEKLLEGGLSARLRGAAGRGRRVAAVQGVLAPQDFGVVARELGRLGLAREQLLEALHVALLVGRHLGGKGTHRVVGGMLGDVDIEILRAPLGGERELIASRAVFGERA